MSRLALILIAVLAGGIGLAACHGGEHAVTIEHGRPGDKGNGGGGGGGGY